MPFTWPQILGDTQSNRKVEDKRVNETIQHARLISDRHNSLTDIDINTAEAIARMVNAGKIFAGLLVYLTGPRPRTDNAVIPTKSPTTEDKGFQPTQRPFPAAPKRRKPLLAADELQGLGPVLKHKRVVSNLENCTDSVIVAEEDSPGGENSVQEDTSVVRKSLPEEHVAPLKSSKEVKVSKKNKQGGKRVRNERTKNEATSTVSAYPTQRPPRKKSAKKSTTTRDSSERKRLGPEKCDLEQVSATRQALAGGSDLEENAPEEWLFSEDSPQEDLGSPESTWEEYGESKGHNSQGGFDIEGIESDDRFSSSDTVASENLIRITDKPIERGGSGVQGLLWAYASNTTQDKTLDDTGIWLWEKPKTHFRTEPLSRTEKCGLSILASVVVSHERTRDNEPEIEFDGEIVHIVPHEQCWEDARSHKSHPDFLIPWKLAEYQANEAAGYQVWRHDRDLLKCRKPDCGATVSDYHHSAVVCLNCGPKSVVRYCSLQHQLEDIEGHWKECGTWKTVLQRLIDHTTAPSKFARMFPAIKQRHGSITAALHRQRLYCALTYGHYTLFDPASSRSETLCWPKHDPKWAEMDRRVERLLNVAFLDGWNHYVLGYLYRLLRELFRSRGGWSNSVERCLKLQFEAEFSDYKVNVNWHDGVAPCQCEWSGRIFPRYDHLPTCWVYATADDGYRPLRRPNCIERTVEDYEERFWILRAWRQQHPTQNNWRLRAAGYGFPDTTPDGECYELGPGWTGWGGNRDNICEDHGDQGSMRSA